MKTHLIRIGNSRGIRLPKSIIDEVGLVEEIEMEVQQDKLVIRPSRDARAGWAAAALVLARTGDHGLLDAPVATRFDAEEWTW